MNGSAERRPLKILHIDPERNWGGGEAQVIGLLTYLAGQGHRNHLLADPDGQLLDRSRRLDVASLPLVLRNDLDLRGVPMIRRQIGREKYDVVHFHTKRAHALSWWLPRGSGSPKYVVTRRMDYPERCSWRTRRLYNRNVDGVVAISQAIVELLVRAGVPRPRIRLIPSGIDAGRFSALPDRPAARDGDCVVGCLGVLERRKGHSELLAALSMLRRRGMKIRCLVGGEGSLRAELERQAVHEGLQDAVGFLGFVSDVEKFLAAVDVFVMASRFEGLGVAALEAMAAGRPVVASRVGGLAESVVDGETGLLVPAGDVTALAEGIGTLARDPGLAREMGRKGRERVVKEFSMDEMARRNEEFYYELLAH